jgi:2-polyprenyl-3-methyl-5-hydroxy-6-metoxy-1,4-benzoquinol methylase
LTYPQEGSITPEEFLKKRLPTVGGDDYRGIISEMTFEEIDQVVEGTVLPGKLLELLSKGDRVLDVGSYVGSYWYSKDYHITAVDIDPSLRDKVPEYVDFQCVNAEALNLDGEFDVVVANHILEHVEKPNLLIKNSVKLLKMGGSMYIGYPEGTGWPNRLYQTLYPGSHVTNVSLDDVVDWLQDNGMRVDYVFEWPDDFKWLSHSPKTSMMEEPIREATRVLDYAHGTNFSRYGWGVVATKIEEQGALDKRTADKALVVLSNVIWGSRRQRPQHIYSRLAPKFKKAYYVSCLTHHQKNCVTHLEGDLHGAVLYTTTGGRVDKLPLSEIATLRESLWKMLEEDGFTRKDAVVVVDIPYWGRVLSKGEYGKLVYNCMDWAAGFHDLADDDILAWEQQLLAAADTAIFTSQPLAERLGPNVDHYAVIRNACEHGAFSRFLNTKPTQRPHDLPQTNLPIIGYYGTIADWFDVDVVAEAAKSLANEAVFVLIGDHTYGGIEKLRALPNVHLLGEKPYPTLPLYLYYFNICLIPFRLNDLTDCTNPVKQYEYMAAGKPVIASRLPELEKVFLPGTVEFYDDGEHLANIVRYLTQNVPSNDSRERRSAWASAHTWDSRAEEFYLELVPDNTTRVNTGPGLSVIVPILNEEHYLPDYIESVRRFADQLVISDGGSTDNSLDIIRDYDQRYPGWIKLIHHNQDGLPYTEGWSENVCRNGLLDAVDNDFILWLDSDEMMSDNFVEEYKRLLDPAFDNLYRFPFVAFWRDFYTKRVNHPNDPRWDVHISRMWRQRPGVRYQDKKTHCQLTLNGRRYWENQHTTVDSVTMYHLHYAVGFKPNDNRRGDVGAYNPGDPVKWDFLDTVDMEYTVKTAPYNGPWPEAIRRRYGITEQ